MTRRARKSAATRRALLIEDDDAVRRSLQLLLHWRGYDVRSYPALAPALASEDSVRAHVLVVDYRLPDGSGLDLPRALAGRGWHGRAVLITDFFSPELEEMARSRGFAAVLEKPLQQHRLLMTLTP